MKVRAGTEGEKYSGGMVDARMRRGCAAGYFGEIQQVWCLTSHHPSPHHPPAYFDDE